MAAFYKAPEAEQLFGITKPVADKAHDLSEDVRVISRALGTYAREITPLVHQLEQLKRGAAEFRAKEAAEDDWSEDGDLAEENLNRHNKIAEVWAAFQEAERARGRPQAGGRHGAVTQGRCRSRGGDQTPRRQDQAARGDGHPPAAYGRVNRSATRQQRCRRSRW
ncbi:hypothetical protein [Streptomyces sp. NPDC020742]|uniref:hypothetical protein n=1 Tax=unclassified Streptomyces TaxID=2593676 RepID=UPI0033D74B32